ncbi:hypothetical protein GALMADRAFT_222266 [Galerina marginata CBS 339.88]|uniref:C3H1-type domain-containing protein n=1 Tax=Galerina marginata (strain CBS 339.88) TaxID=685588 RepID=A0A067TBS6_GALM3|nr:hypothetical protein GALMADRAFT_222266 [Galerina marginata CBS 339.88]
MASSSAATEAQIKSEIERLTATISQHKAHQKNKSWKTGVNYYAPYPQGGPGRSNAYVNPNYKPSNKYVRPGLDEAGPSKPPSTATATPLTNQTPIAARTTEPGPSTTAASVLPDSSNPVPSLGGQKTEVVLGGVAFESSRRSLVRKDLPKSASIGRPISTPAPHHYTRKAGHVHPSKVFKLKARRGRNMTLNNTRRPYTSSRKTNKRVNKYVDKPCPRFTTTGSCSRGLTCMYQHDPSKIAICWNFLQGNCPKTAETCDLSHEPTPERTPLCVHFLNKGRCTRENCPFPHVNVGQRQGVCRDFAVLGYCERGLECDRQHVRECPDFAEKGTCGTKGCKLPHVIRANRNRKVAAPNVTAMESIPVAGDKVGSVVAPAGGDQAMVTAEDGQLGDEFISLTFKESDSEDDEEEEEEEEDDESGSEESGSEIMDIVA